MKFVVWGLNMRIGVSPWSCCSLVVLRCSASNLAGNASETSGFSALLANVLHYITHVL